MTEEEKPEINALLDSYFRNSYHWYLRNKENIFSHIIKDQLGIPGLSMVERTIRFSYQNEIDDQGSTLYLKHLVKRGFDLKEVSNTILDQVIINGCDSKIPLLVKAGFTVDKEQFESQYSSLQCVMEYGKFQYLDLYVHAGMKQLPNCFSEEGFPKVGLLHCIIGQPEYTIQDKEDNQRALFRINTLMTQYADLLPSLSALDNSMLTKSKQIIENHELTPEQQSNWKKLSSAVDKYIKLTSPEPVQKKKISP